MTRKLIILQCVFWLLAPQKKIAIIERTIAVPIYAGYYIAENDSTFLFHHQKYLIKQTEYFDGMGTLQKVARWNSEGYIVFDRTEFIKLKDFIPSHNLSDHIEAAIINDKQLLLNGNTIRGATIDLNQNEIFYSIRNNKDTLYRLEYR